MMRKLANQAKQTVQTLQTGVRSAFRGVLNWVQSAPDVQRVQVSGLAEETLQEVELLQHFGLTSVPPAGSQAVILPLGGKTSHAVVIATECAQFRVKGLQNGEVAIYDQSGSTVILKQGRVIEMDCDRFQLTCKTFQVNASEQAAFTSPLLSTSEQLTAQGQINGNGGMAVQGGSGARFSGSVQQTGGNFLTDGDVQAGAISLKAHRHNEQGDGKPTSPAM